MPSPAINAAADAAGYNPQLRRIAVHPRVDLGYGIVAVRYGKLLDWACQLVSKELDMRFVTIVAFALAVCPAVHA
jgi:hypothetical protein